MATRATYNKPGATAAVPTGGTTRVARVAGNTTRTASPPIVNRAPPAETSAGTPTVATRAVRSGTGNTIPMPATVPAQTATTPARVVASGRVAGVAASGSSAVRARVPQGARGTAEVTDSSFAMAPTRTTSRNAPTVATFTGSDAMARAKAAPQAQTRSAMRAKRVSKIIVEKEKKTEYWLEIVKSAKERGGNLSSDDINNIISRAMAFDIVGNWKQREASPAPTADQLFQELEINLEQRLEEITGKSVSINGSGIERIKNLENLLQSLESQKEKEKDEEETKVRNAVGDLQNTLKGLAEKKEKEVETKRKTMNMEINNLREQLSQMQQQTNQSEKQALEDKVTRLESQLSLLNVSRRTGIEDEQTVQLKKKLALFEAKLAEMAEEKKLAQAEDHGGQLREKLLLMEEKLMKMERRKSVSLVMMVQQKIQETEQDLATLRSRGGPGSADKIAELEAKLKELQNTKITPAMINDSETNTLRSNVKKLEEAMRLAEKKMEEQRLKLEEERLLAWEKRQREEEEYRKKARMREEMLLQKMAEMEKRIQQRAAVPPSGGSSGGGGGGGGGVDHMIKRLEDMEKRLKETEAQLEKERGASAIFNSVLASKDGPEREAMEKDFQIAVLKQTTEALFKKLEETQSNMESKFKDFDSKIKNIQIAPGGANIPQSGLSFAEINAKLAEIQAKLFDENTPEREAEALNIEYEKLIAELEQTPEYLKEQEEAADKWRKENEPINQAALDALRQKLGSMQANARTQLLQRKPELKFVGFTPDQIMKKHVNDFSGLTTQSLTEEEARALYACMPKFRKDQEKQLQFYEQLRNKIEIEVKKPKTKAPPPIQPQKKVVFKKPPSGGGGGGGGASFLDELMKKRKAVN